MKRLFLRCLARGPKWQRSRQLLLPWPLLNLGRDSLFLCGRLAESHGSSIEPAGCSFGPSLAPSSGSQRGFITSVNGTVKGGPTCYRTTVTDNSRAVYTGHKHSLPLHQCLSLSPGYGYRPERRGQRLNMWPGFVRICSGISVTKDKAAARGPSRSCVVFFNLKPGLWWLKSCPRPNCACVRHDNMHT